MKLDYASIRIERGKAPKLAEAEAAEVPAEAAAKLAQLSENEKKKIIIIIK